MPPLETRPGSYYSTESDSDFDSLMERALAGEFEVIEVSDETNETTYLFSPPDERGDTDLIPHAMIEGVVRGFTVGNRIISDGKDLRDVGNY